MSVSETPCLLRAQPETMILADADAGGGAAGGSSDERLGQDDNSRSGDRARASNEPAGAVREYDAKATSQCYGGPAPPGFIRVWGRGLFQAMLADRSAAPLAEALVAVTRGRKQAREAMEADRAEDAELSLAARAAAQATRAGHDFVASAIGLGPAADATGVDGAARLASDDGDTMSEMAPLRVCTLESQVLAHAAELERRTYVALHGDGNGPVLGSLTPGSLAQLEQQEERKDMSEADDDDANSGGFIVSRPGSPMGQVHDAMMRPPSPALEFPKTPGSPSKTRLLFPGPDDAAMGSITRHGSMNVMDDEKDEDEDEDGVSLDVLRAAGDVLPRYHRVLARARVVRAARTDEAGTAVDRHAAGVPHRRWGWQTLEVLPSVRGRFGARFREDADEAEAARKPSSLCDAALAPFVLQDEMRDAATRKPLPLSDFSAEALETAKNAFGSGDKDGDSEGVSLRLPREEFAAELGGWLEAWVEAPLLRETRDREAVQEAVRRASDADRDEGYDEEMSQPRGAWMVVELSMDQGASWVPVRCPQRLAAPELGAPETSILVLPPAISEFGSGSSSRAFLELSVSGQGLVPCDCQARFRVHGGSEGEEELSVAAEANVVGEEQLVVRCDPDAVATGLGLLARRHRASSGAGVGDGAGDEDEDEEGQLGLVEEGEAGFRLAQVEVSFDGGMTYSGIGTPVLLLRPGSVGGAWPGIVPAVKSVGAAVVSIHVSGSRMIGGEPGAVAGGGQQLVEPREGSEEEEGGSEQAAAAAAGSSEGEVASMAGVEAQGDHGLGSWIPPVSVLSAIGMGSLPGGLLARVVAKSSGAGGAGGGGVNSVALPASALEPGPDGTALLVLPGLRDVFARETTAQPDADVSAAAEGGGNEDGAGAAAGGDAGDDSNGHHHVEFELLVEYSVDGGTTFQSISPLSSPSHPSIVPSDEHESSASASASALESLAVY